MTELDSLLEMRLDVACTDLARTAFALNACGDGLGPVTGHRLSSQFGAYGQTQVACRAIFMTIQEARGMFDGTNVVADAIWDAWWALAVEQGEYNYPSTFIEEVRTGERLIEP
jgi:hypothetical protein